MTHNDLPARTGDITPIHHLSDFTLMPEPVDIDGHALPVDGADFLLEFYVPPTSPVYKAWMRGGKCVNCAVADGRLSVTFKDHRLPPGRLTVRWTTFIPDSPQPDGVRRVTFSRPCPVELVREGGCTGAPVGSVAFEVTLPYVYADAYRLALAQGYAGTAEEYAAALSDIPEVVAGCRTLASLAAETAAGKSAIAEALTAQGVPTDPAAPMDEMARGIRSLYAVPTPDAGSMDDRLHHTGADTTAAIDIHNTVARHRRADFPYVCGASFTITGPDRTITLPACDAALLSDGTGLHGVAAGTAVTISGSATAAWAVFYFREDFFAWPWIDGVVHHDLCALGCHPCFSASSARPFVRLTADADPAPYDGHDLAFASGSGDLALSSVASLPSGSTLINGGAARSVRLPALRSASRAIADGCGALTHLELPALESASGIIANNCGALTLLDLPGLTEATASIIAYQTVTTLRLPRLRTLATSMPRCSVTDLHLDSCTVISGYRVLAYLSVAHMYAPALVSASRCTFEGVTSCRLHLGSQQGADINLEGGNIIDLTVLPGFTGTLVFPTATALTADCLRALLANLGDNTGGATCRIQMGPDNLAKLTDDEIAVATAKNYTLS